MAPGRGFNIKQSLLSGIAIVGFTGVKMGSVDYWKILDPELINQHSLW